MVNEFISVVKVNSPWVNKHGAKEALELRRPDRLLAKKRVG
jgi:hypothetical protein